MTGDFVDLGLGHIRTSVDRPLGLPTCGETYGPAEGEPELRRIVAERHGVRFDEVAVTTGASLGLTATIATLPRQGSILCPWPHYPLYPEVIALFGLTPKFYHTRQLQDAASCSSLAQLVDADTRAILLNLPGNPTGEIPAIAALESVRDIAERNNLLVISDEVYADLIYDPIEWPDVRRICGPHCVQLRSFSKTLQIPGERLGYVIADEDRLPMVCRAHWALAMSPPATAQMLAARMMQSDLSSYLEDLRRHLRRNRNQATDILKTCSRIQFDVPPAGIFLWIKVDCTETDSRKLARRCSSQAGVVVTPGASMGVDAPVHLRVSFAVPEPELDKGYRALLGFFNVM